MVMHTLPADVIKNPLIRLVPLKSARAAGEGRLIALAPASARALAIYLRVRRHHALADSDWVWLGTRNRGRLQTTGLRLMLIRRAEQAGYQGVTPHQFRHTFSDDWQIGRIAFGATFPQECDRDAAGDAGRPHRWDASALHRESAGQGGCVDGGCIKSINVAPDSVALNDRLLRPPQRQRRSDAGRCHRRLVVQLTHSARRQQCSLPV
jgi:hypothetical protein